MGFLPGDEVGRAVAYAGGKGLRRMGAFAPNTPYGRLAVEALQASAARYGGTVERATLVPEQGSDMAGMAREFAGNTSYDAVRSEEHTSELQSLMRISYAVFCLKKKKKK